MLPIFDTLVLFVLGTILGSFINALLFRFNTGKSMWGRSACMTCGETLHSRDLIPVFSYLLMGGKCRFCSSRVSFQYPIVEILAGVISVFSFAANPELTSFVLVLTFFNLLLFIGVYDLRHTIIPDVFVFAAGAVALLYQFALSNWQISLIDPYALLAGPILALPLACIWAFSKGRAMGLGDAKLFLAAGWFLGFLPGIAAFLISFWGGAIVGVLLLLFKTSFAGKQVRMKSEIPFGPFIIAAVAVVYFARIDVFTIFSILK